MTYRCRKCQASFDKTGRTECPLCDTPIGSSAPSVATPLTDAGRSLAGQVVEALAEVGVQATVAGEPKPKPAKKVAEKKPAAAEKPKAVEKTIDVKLLAEAYQMALMGCGGTHAGVTSTLVGQRPAGWQSGKWRGDTMPKSEMSAWCTHARKKASEAGFEVENQKADGPTLVGLFGGRLAK